jgi:hypothetical protein
MNVKAYVIVAVPILVLPYIAHAEDAHKERQQRDQMFDELENMEQKAKRQPAGKKAESPPPRAQPGPLCTDCESCTKAARQACCGLNFVPSKVGGQQAQKVYLRNCQTTTSIATQCVWKEYVVQAKPGETTSKKVVKGTEKLVYDPNREGGCEAKRKEASRVCAGTSSSKQEVQIDCKDTAPGAAKAFPFFENGTKLEPPGRSGSVAYLPRSQEDEGDAPHLNEPRTEVITIDPGQARTYTIDASARSGLVVKVVAVGEGARGLSVQVIPSTGTEPVLTQNGIPWGGAIRALATYEMPDSSQWLVRVLNRSAQKLSAEVSLAKANIVAPERR